MNRMKPLAALFAGSLLMLALGGCRSHTTIIEPQPQSQPRPDHHNDYHGPPPPPDRHDDHHDDRSNDHR